MKLVIANHKMHCTLRESTALARGVLRGIRALEHPPEIVLCPSFPALGEVRRVIASTHVMLGAQNIAPCADAALTGEVSGAQLRDAGCACVLVGHSERRRMLGETDALVHEKIVQAYAKGITPIVCVGEDAQARAAGRAHEVVGAQVRAAFADVVVPGGEQVILAYEPLWAIGSDESDAPSDIVAMHQEIRRVLSALLPRQNVRMVYGGSVDSKNAHRLLAEREIDGVLVGGASVRIAEFVQIIHAAAETQTAPTV